MNLIDMGKHAKQAAIELGVADSKLKNKALKLMADVLLENKDKIIEANKIDLEDGKKKGLSSALMDRLTLNDDRIRGMADSLVQISKFEEPVGKVLEKRTLHNGLKLRKVSTPIGVVCIIYESRPNVTSDVIGLCLKSGNVTILKGGSEAINSNRVISKLLVGAAKQAGLPEHIIHFIDSTDRSLVNELLKMNDYIDLVIPRGGDGLIKFVAENSTIPVIKHHKGICHTYVDASANLDKAVKICINAKCQRPGVCNAMETLLVHEGIAKDFLPKMAEEFKKNNVEIKGCDKTRKIIDAEKATEEDWKTEYLDLIISIKVVKNVDEAISFINKYGTGHSDAILTNNKKNADKFTAMVDSSSVYVNTSTRFTDGGEFGLGAEIGISTQKLHARGPMGANELTSYKFIVEGEGQIRE